MNSRAILAVAVAAILCSLSALLVHGASTQVPGCAGALDSTFDLPGGITIPGYAPYPSWVTAIIVEPDGKVIVGGLFSHAGGQARGSLIRLLPSGALDVTFTPNLSGLNVRAVVRQASGKIVVAANENNYLSPTGQVFRLNSDGSRDSTFTSTNFFYEIGAMVGAPDGSVFVASVVDGAEVWRIVKLSPDGVIDASFAAPDYELPLRLVALQPDGKLIVNGVERLRADGSRDPDFGSPIPFGEITALALQPDGKLLLAVRTEPVPYRYETFVRRANSDGTLDESFEPAVVKADPYAGSVEQIFQLLVQPDGKVLVAGSFSRVNGTTGVLIARLNDNGSVDPTFQTTTEFCAGCDEVEGISTMAFAADEKLVIGGYFKTINGVARENIARLHLGANGCGGVFTLTEPLHVVSETNSAAQVVITRQGDTNLSASIAYRTATNYEYGSLPAVPGTDYVEQIGVATFAPGEVARTITIPVLNDAHMEWNRPFEFLLNASSTSLVGRTAATRVVIVDDDSLGKPGSLDPSFQSLTVPPPLWLDVHHIALEPSGSIIAAIESTPQYTHRIRLIRMFTDGTVDPSLNISLNDGSWRVDALAVDSQGRIIVGGSLSVSAGVVREGLVRFNADGSVDPNFAVGVSGYIRSVLVLPDDSVLAAGSFTVAPGSRANLVRFNSDGSLDPTFDALNGPVRDQGGTLTPGVYAMARAADGKIIVGGWFNRVNGFVATNLARLNVNGSLDTNFVPQLSGQGSVSAIAIDGSQRIIVGGSLLFIANGMYRSVARLLGDGSLDATFVPATTTQVRALAVQPDQKILVNGLERFDADGSTDPTFFSGSALVSVGDARIALQADGNVLVAGFFQRFNELPRTGIVRLIGGNLPDGVGVFGLSGPSIRVNENAGAATIQVTRGGGAHGRASVMLVTSDGSAFAGEHYTAVATNLVFEDGDAAPRTVSIPVVDNNLAEGDRGFYVQLLDATGGAVIGPNAKATVELIEDDLGVSMARPDEWVAEGMTAYVGLKRIGPTNTSFRATCVSSGGTAVANVDYVPVTTNISFAAGDTMKYVGLPTITNSTAQLDRTVTLTLQQPTGALISQPTTTTVTIVDNQRAPAVRFVGRPAVGQSPLLQLDVRIWQSWLLEASSDLVHWQTVNSVYRGQSAPPTYAESYATNYNARFYRLRRAP